MRPWSFLSLAGQREECLNPIIIRYARQRHRRDQSTSLGTVKEASKGKPAPFHANEGARQPSENLRRNYYIAGVRNEVSTGEAKDTEELVHSDSEREDVKAYEMLSTENKDSFLPTRQKGSYLTCLDVSRKHGSKARKPTAISSAGQHGLSRTHALCTSTTGRRSSSLHIYTTRTDALGTSITDGQWIHTSIRA
ncbi:hypothetical protein Taro_001742, partial [Colocasia esculenta]|nr:hypothetical protein [Colocasia esculenta]